jgi:DNA modification methylase
MFTPYYDLDGITLYQGDCTAIMPWLIEQGIMADLILTDPPYGKAYKSNMGGKERRENVLTRSAVMTESIANDEDLQILEDALPWMDKLLLPNRHSYLFCDPEKIPEVRALVKKQTSWNHKQTLIWDKGECGTMGDIKAGYSQNFEALVYSDSGRREFPSGKRPRAIARFQWQSSWEPIHPNRKPPPLMEYYAIAGTKPGELVLDPFCGSGPVARACKNLGRRYIGIELLEHHCASMVRTMQQNSLLAGWQ